ncbi:MAG: hypothetical protein GMKNLPBB_02402 [Myxococcota bacterium]|nr:hypothetical protein [Myxococcota bacterium]
MKQNLIAFLLLLAAVPGFVSCGGYNGAQVVPNSLSLGLVTRIRVMDKPANGEAEPYLFDDVSLESRTPQLLELVPPDNADQYDPVEYFAVPRAQGNAEVAVWRRDRLKTVLTIPIGPPAAHHMALTWELDGATRQALMSGAASIPVSIQNLLGEPVEE